MLLVFFFDMLNLLKDNVLMQARAERHTGCEARPVNNHRRWCAALVRPEPRSQGPGCFWDVLTVLAGRRFNVDDFAVQAALGAGDSQGNDCGAVVRLGAVADEQHWSRGGFDVLSDDFDCLEVEAELSGLAAAATHVEAVAGLHHAVLAGLRGFGGEGVLKHETNVERSAAVPVKRSEEHTSELQSRGHL